MMFADPFVQEATLLYVVPLNLKLNWICDFLSTGAALVTAVYAPAQGSGVVPSEFDARIKATVRAPTSTAFVQLKIEAQGEAKPEDARKKAQHQRRDNCKFDERTTVLTGETRAVQSKSLKSPKNPHTFHSKLQFINIVLFKTYKS